MNRTNTLSVAGILILFSTLSTLTVAAPAAKPAAAKPAPAAAPAVVEAAPEKPVKLGTLTFEAPVNVSAFTIRGEATKVDAAVRVAGMIAQELRVSVPVESLTTKMGMRDKHMRERIFTTTDGKTPDVEFKAKDVKCTGTPDKMECPTVGTLSLRGTPKPASFTILVARNGALSTASGQTVVKLSDYGIPAPEQLGVKVKDDVTVKFEVSF